MERRWHLRHVEGEGLGAKVELDWRVGVYADDGVEGQLLRLGGEGRPEVGAVQREEDAFFSVIIRRREAVVLLSPSRQPVFSFISLNMQRQLRDRGAAAAVAALNGTSRFYQTRASTTRISTPRYFSTRAVL